MNKIALIAIALAAGFGASHLTSAAFAAGGPKKGNATSKAKPNKRVKTGKTTPVVQPTEYDNLRARAMSVLEARPLCLCFDPSPLKHGTKVGEMRPVMATGEREFVGLSCLVPKFHKGERGPATLCNKYEVLM